MNYPKISIVTPSYNQGKFIEETILSIINQNYPNLEYIIIDGGSTDNSVEIIKKYEEHLTYWISEPDKGQSDAIQKGFKKCTGKIFNWLNSDDTLEPDSLFILAASYNTAPNKMVFAGYLTIINQPKIPKHHIYIGKTEKDTLINYDINQPATFYRLDIFKQIGINVILQYVMDLDIWFRFILTYGNANVKYINSVLANFRYHDLSKSVSNSHKENYGREERALRFYLGLVAGLKQSDMEIALPFFLNDYQAEKNKFSVKEINSKFKRQIKSFFYKDCAIKSYISKKYKKARSYFYLYIINGCIDFDFNTFLFIVKSYIRPRWLINLYRKVFK